MSYPDRNNPYSFDDYLAWRRSVDYYADDPFLRAVLNTFAGADAGEADREARAFSPKPSFRWRDMADEIALPENRPYLVNYDGHRHRVDRIVRPAATLLLEKEVFSEAFFSPKTPPWVRLVKMFLTYQNGEACIGCPVVCTEGLVAVLERHADTPETKRILEHCRDGVAGEFAIGAQYLSEIQGGSDVPSNLVEAVQEDGVWRLYGNKFFCSATHADYAAVTAKPAGSEKIALFVVPSWLPGDRERERRNGYTIDRIKWKMGTSELTTAEITFNGAEAYPVGPLERGLSNVVGIVLTFSRLTVGLSAAAYMTRAAREAEQYARMRTAFGVPVARFPMLAAQVRDMVRAARRTTAGAFRLYAAFLGLPGGLGGGSADEPEAFRRRRFEVRELIMLQKIAAAFDCTDVVRSAMSVFGGHGVMEDFSCLPRLYRDAAVNELWEGPRNVLLTQMHRDFQKASWYRPADFVKSVLAGHDGAEVDRLAGEMEELLSHPNLLSQDEKTMEVCRRWDRFCHEFYHAYQDQALAMTGFGS